MYHTDDEGGFDLCHECVEKYSLDEAQLQALSLLEQVRHPDKAHSETLAAAEFDWQAFEDETLGSINEGNA